MYAAGERLLFPRLLLPVKDLLKSYTAIFWMWIKVIIKMEPPEIKLCSTLNAG